MKKLSDTAERTIEDVQAVYERFLARNTSKEAAATLTLAAMAQINGSCGTVFEK